MSEFCLFPLKENWVCEALRLLPNTAPSELALGHGLFLKNDVIHWKWTLEENSLLNNLSQSTLPLLHSLLSFHSPPPSCTSESLSAYVSSTLCLPAHTPHLFLSLVLFGCLSPLFRPSCGGVVPCARPQPKAGRPEGDAECRGRDRFRVGRLPPQWCCHPAEILPGGAARASAHAQTLSCSPEDRRYWLGLEFFSYYLWKLLSKSSSLLFYNNSFFSLCPELTRFDDEGNKTNVPDKERQIEAFQLLFMLLPSANRSLLKLLLDLLYHTARNQHVNKMSAINLATMFAPHIIWPKNVRTSGSLFTAVSITVKWTSIIISFVLLLFFFVFHFPGVGKWSAGKHWETQ